MNNFPKTLFGYPVVIVQSRLDTHDDKGPANYTLGTFEHLRMMKGMSPMSHCTFYARVWLSADDVEEIEVWVHELQPTKDAKRLPSDEWVQDHFQDQWNRDKFMKLISGPKPGKGYQILIRGTLEGHKGYWDDEYYEHVEIESSQYEELPDDWFEDTEYRITEPAKPITTTKAIFTEEQLRNLKWGPKPTTEPKSYRWNSQVPNAS